MDVLFGTAPSWPLFIARVALGVIFFAHGAQKLFGWFGGHGLRGTIGYFQQTLGIPPALAVLAALTECFGGLAVRDCSRPSHQYGPRQADEGQVELEAVTLTLLQRPVGQESRVHAEMRTSR